MSTDPELSTVAKAKSDLGVAARRRDPAAIYKARQGLAAANLAAHIKRVVDAAPPLTEEHVAHLQRLLRRDES